MTKRIINLLTVLVMTVSLAGVLPASTASADYWGVWQYNILNDGTVEITGFSDDSVTSLDIPATLNGYTVTSIGSDDWRYSGFAHLTSITIPDSVTSIGDYAFSVCSSLTSITIPNSVTSIGYEAFYESGLSSVKIGNGVTYIGEDAFKYCGKLTNVIMGNSIEIIDNCAFCGCESLKSITIPDSVTSIGYEAFYDCESLSSIIIPENVTSIGRSAFYNCSGLTSVVMPKNITSIGYSTFSGCTNKNLKIYLLGEITDIESKAFSDVVGKVYVRDSSIIVALPLTLTPILLNDYGDCGDNAMWFLDSNGVMTILGSGSINNELGASWRDYNEDITSVVIEKNITNIGDYAFYSCSNLSKITIPDSVTSIGNSAFKDCYALTSVTIPKSVTSIGEGAFDGCETLTIKCYQDSYAEQYAKENNVKYELLDGSNTPNNPSNPSDSSNPSGSGQSQPSGSGSTQPTSAQPATNAPTTVAPKVTPPTATTVTKPAKVKSVNLKAKKKKLNVSWKKVSGATGYEVMYAKNNKFTKVKKTVKVKKNKVTLKRLKSNKKYFVKVRAYKKANGNTSYGNWSKVVKKKVK